MNSMHFCLACDHVFKSLSRRGFFSSISLVPSSIRVSVNVRVMVRVGVKVMVRVKFRVRV